MRLDDILNRRLLIISGKGGVGKTTTAAALGVVAARRGLKVLIAEVEGRGSLASLFNGEGLGHEPTELKPGLFAMNISPDESLREYFEIAFRLKRIARPLLSSGLVYYVAHAAPGLRDILMLGKVWDTATRVRNYDLIVLDTPAAGHAVSMLRSPEGFLHAVPIGPLASHTRRLARWLQDPDEVSIYLVALAEEMPVNETIETTHLLEEKLRMDVAGVFVNMIYPPATNDPETLAEFDKLSGPEDLIERERVAGHKLDKKIASSLYECASFYRHRRSLQQGHRKDLAKAIEHTAPLVDLPFVFRDSFGNKEVELLADAIESQVTQ